MDEGGIEDGEGDAFTSADGKADGYDLTEAQALAVMKVAGEGTPASLKEAGFSTRVADGISNYRSGKDKRLGTADDQAFDSLAELDAVPYVGPATLEKLLEVAETSGAYKADALGRHDVSILLPLPAAGADLPWSATTAGRGGALLPRTVFDKIGRSVFNSIADENEYDALRVIGVRIDPCFTVTLTSACQPQIRLIFQALALQPENGTEDGAVHALYNLTAEQFADVTTRLQGLSAPQNKAYQGLGVSPVLKSQGLRGAYATALGKVITDYAGPATLARMTFVTRTGSRQSQWELGGFHVKASADTMFPAPGPIAIMPGVELQVIANAGFGGINYNITPGIADDAGMPGTSSFTIGELTATQQKTVQAWAIKQQSPLQTVPDTTDCVSCHIAGHTSRLLEEKNSALVTLDRGPRALTPAETVGDNLRAFGYFGKDPFVSIRTANETAAVLRALEAR